MENRVDKKVNYSRKFYIGGEILIEFALALTLLYCGTLLFGFVKQTLLTKEKNNWVLTKVIYDEKKPQLVFNNVKKVSVVDYPEISNFEKYVGEKLNLVLSYDENRKCIYNIDLIKAFYNGHRIPDVKPYYYTKRQTLFLGSIVYAIFFSFFYAIMKYRILDRTDRIISDRIAVFDRINKRIDKKYVVGKNILSVVNCPDGWSEIINTYSKHIEDYVIEYKLSYHDTDDGVLWMKRKVEFHFNSLIIKRVGSSGVVVDLTCKYHRNMIDSNLFHPEDVLPFANQILDEIDEQIRLRLPDIKI